MYEKTVAGIHKIYKFTANGSWNSVYGSLSIADKTEIDDIISLGKGLPQYTNSQVGGNVARMVVDGYLKSDNIINISTKSDGSVSEAAPVDQPYSCPIVDWVNNTYVMASNGVVVVVRILFS